MGILKDLASKAIVEKFKYTEKEFIKQITRDNRNKINEMMIDYEGSEGRFARVYEEWEESNRELNANEYINAVYDSWINRQ
jgi:putative sterol carrier protein